MKHLFKIFYLVLLAVALQNCTEKEDATPTNEKVQFSLDLKTIPDGASLRLSIQKSTGESVLNLEEVELRMDEGIVKTAPLELARGNYKVTDFLIVSEANQISYATPKKGSPMASQVKNAIDLNFSVQKSAASTIAMEVISVANSLPENFGYKTFDLDIIHPLKLAIYVPSGSFFKLTAAKAYILQGIDTLQYFNLTAKINILPFKKEVNQQYTLLIVKDGYLSSKTDFVYEDTMATLAGAPLNVTLTQAFTFLAYTEDYTESPFSITMGGPAGRRITVYWGDGIVENYTLQSDLYLTHDYPAAGNYPVAITGDLKYITFFKSYYGQGEIDKINLDHLTNLVDLTFGWTRSPQILDLTHNTKIEFLNLSYLKDVRTINLPTNNRISTILVGGPSKLTVASLNDIISKVYNSAVRVNRHDGSFGFEKSWESENVMIRTPSPAALAMLRDLRDHYGWTIYPNP